MVEKILDYKFSMIEYIIIAECDSKNYTMIPTLRKLLTKYLGSSYTNKNKPSLYVYERNLTENKVFSQSLTRFFYDSITELGTISLYKTSYTSIENIYTLEEIEKLMLVENQVFNLKKIFSHKQYVGAITIRTMNPETEKYLKFFKDNFRKSSIQNALKPEVSETQAMMLLTGFSSPKT